MDVTAFDEEMMRRALQLARCGELGASPNPMVGAVVTFDGHRWPISINCRKVPYM